MSVVVAFPTRNEFEKARSCMDSMRLSYEVLSPDPGYSLVGAPALVCDSQGLAGIQSGNVHQIAVSGWVDLKPAISPVPQSPPPEFQENIFGKAVIMFFGPCMADETRIRLIAHLSGDLSAVLPYLNTKMPAASFNANAPSLTFFDEHRLITLYARRVTITSARLRS